MTFLIVGAAEHNESRAASTTRKWEHRRRAGDRNRPRRRSRHGFRTRRRRLLDLSHDSLKRCGPVDLVLDVIGGEVYTRSLEVLRPGGRIVTVAEPPPVRPEGGDAIFFVVEAARSRLVGPARRVTA